MQITSSSFVGWRGPVWHFNPWLDVREVPVLPLFLSLSSSFPGHHVAHPLTHPLPDFLSHPGTKHVLCL